MSKFSVTPPELTTGSANLGTMSAELAAAHAELAGNAGAADGTPASGAFGELLGRWSSALPQFGAAGDGIAGAVGAAAERYLNQDNAVAAAATPGDTPAAAE